MVLILVQPTPSTQFARFSRITRTRVQHQTSIAHNPTGKIRLRGRIVFEKYVL